MVDAADEAEGPAAISLIGSASAGLLRGRMAQATLFFRQIVNGYEYTRSSSASWLHLANMQIVL